MRAKSLLGLDNRGLATLFDVSLRTVERLVAGRSPVYDDMLRRLAAAVYPKDPALAARLAAEADETLEGLGIVAPARAPAPAVDPPAPIAPPAAAAPSPAIRAVLVESVVAAAAEALDASPRVARPVLLAAAERADVAHVTIADLLEVLRPPPAPVDEKKRKKP